MSNNETAQPAVGTAETRTPITDPRSTVHFRRTMDPSSTEANMFQHLCHQNYRAAVARISKLRETYIRDRYIFVEGSTMTHILRGLGATEGDLASIQIVSERLPLDPTLPFRESKNGRFCFDPDGHAIRRLEFQPFALSAAEDFKRYDSEQLRHFAEIENDLQLNSVFQALLLFKYLILHGVSTSFRPYLDYADSRWICTVFNLRTVTTPDMLGEPALEGVHTDGVDHTMTTFLGSHNMERKSCVTALHLNSEETGIAHDKTRPEHCVSVVQHRSLLDTLVIADNERKHSLSPLIPHDSDARATRDMLIFFTRKPALKGHVSEKMDSRKPHRGLPMEIPLWVPYPASRT